MKKDRYKTYSIIKCNMVLFAGCPEYDYIKARYEDIKKSLKPGEWVELYGQNSIKHVRLEYYQAPGVWCYKIICK